ncbi:proteasome component pup2 [Serendipita sp. 396]|nr:proteasome component pup2 [Serendipita sp. 396]
MEIDAHIGCAMSGLTADARTMIDHARVTSQNHAFTYDERIGVESVTQAVCDLALRFGESMDNESAMMQMTLTEGHHLVLRVLKQVMEEKLDHHNIQLAQVTKENGFQILTESELQDLINSMPPAPAPGTTTAS